MQKYSLCLFSIVKKLKSKVLQFARITSIIDFTEPLFKVISATKLFLAIKYKICEVIIDTILNPKYYQNEILSNTSVL